MNIKDAVKYCFGLTMTLYAVIVNSVVNINVMAMEVASLRS